MTGTSTCPALPQLTFDTCTQVSDFCVLLLMIRWGPHVSHHALQQSEWLWSRTNEPNVSVFRLMMSHGAPPLTVVCRRPPLNLLPPTPPTHWAEPHPSQVRRAMIGHMFISSDRFVPNVKLKLCLTPAAECPPSSSVPVTSPSEYNQDGGLTPHDNRQVRSGPRLGALQQKTFIVKESVCVLTGEEAANTRAGEVIQSANPREGGETSKWCHQQQRRWGDDRFDQLIMSSCIHSERPHHKHISHNWRSTLSGTTPWHRLRLRPHSLTWKHASHDRKC